MKIRRRRYASGKKGWQLDCGVMHGRRVQIAFETRDEAEAEMVRRKAMLRESGHQAFTLTDAERVMFAGLRDRLEAVGATMTEAVEFYLSHARPVREPVTVSELIARCRVAKTEEGLSDRYLKQLKSSTESFAKAGHGGRMAHEIASEDVLVWLRSNEWEPKTWNNYRTDLRTLFQWGIEQKYLSLNPCDAVPRKRLVDGEIAFLDVEEVERLLRRAARPGDGLLRSREANPELRTQEGDFRDCLGAAVLGLFCGLRPERELGEMTWDAVREDVVWVRGHTAKSRSRRVVDLSENARAWLALCPVREGKILPKNFTRKWKALRREVGLFESWPHDAMRHTFATMWLAEHGDEKRLQMLMGHVSAELIYKHYRGQTTPGEARRFWGLVPEISQRGDARA